MMKSPITIEPMQAKYNTEVSKLIAYVFRSKFQNLTTLNDDDLALFFEKLFEHLPMDPANQRMVALQEGAVIGTISVKWKGDPDKKRKQKLSSWKSFKQIGKWNLCKMMIGLYLFKHKPEAAECYIEDVVVHPDHQSKGVGKLLLQWVVDFVQMDNKLDLISLYVSGKNPRAKQLYEQLSFRTDIQFNSLLWHLLFNENKWDYMVMKVK